jgi:hypothetical protein
VTTVPTKVSIKFNRHKHVFFGRVSSDFAGCEGGRKIRLKKVAKRGPRDKGAGKDTSQTDGSWSVKVKGADGTYYAIAKSMTLFTGNGDEVDCLRGRSKNEDV